MVLIILRPVSTPRKPRKDVEIEWIAIWCDGGVALVYLLCVCRVVLKNKGAGMWSGCEVANNGEQRAPEAT